VAWIIATSLYAVAIILIVRRRTEQNYNDHVFSFLGDVVELFAKLIAGFVVTILYLIFWIVFLAVT
jgi:hypothetical protein